MKAMVLTGLNRIDIIDKPDPVISRPDEVLIRMKSVGVCGSDIHYYKEGKIGSQVVSYPFTVGHEGAGIIEQIGSSVKNLKPGDHVAIDPAMPCYSCDQCNTGRFHTCRNLKFLGCPGQSEGCLSEFLVMPAKSCYKLSNSITLDQGALSEPLAIGVYAAKISIPLSQAKIGILGSGPIGISVLLAARAFGAKKIYMTDRIKERIWMAQEMGADWVANPDETDIVKEILLKEPMQLDCVFECCGQQEAVDQAIELLKPGGKLMIIGIPSFNTWHLNVDLMRRKEITVQNVRRQNESVDETLELIKGKKMIPDRMQTHNFTFKEVEKAFEMVSAYKDGVVKAMIHF